jgi:hypothetical protein
MSMTREGMQIPSLFVFKTRDPSLVVFGTRDASLVEV